MTDDTDKSLLHRLQALRGSGAAAAPTGMKIDVIERAKTPTREDVLASRLKRLRNDHGATPAPAAGSPRSDKGRSQHSSSGQTTSEVTAAPDGAQRQYEEADSVLETDGPTLEELLAGVDECEQLRPRDDEVQALLDRLSLSVPKDDDEARDGEHATAAHSDDSDGTLMAREAAHVTDEAKDWKQEEQHGQDANDYPPGQGIAFPSVPSDLDGFSPAAPSSTSLDDITARLAALRAPSPALSLPSVPTSRPSGKPARRLTSTTAYTDTDVDSWCTVCLDDATLRCLGCDGDPYCARCWREMHVGPAAGFDDKDHRAVLFTGGESKDNRKVVLGAS